MTVDGVCGLHAADDNIKFRAGKCFHLRDCCSENLRYACAVRTRKFRITYKECVLCTDGKAASKARLVSGIADRNHMDRAAVGFNITDGHFLPIRIESTGLG